MRMRKVYGEFSSIIRRIPSLPRGQAGTPIWTTYTSHPKSVFYIICLVKLAGSVFLKTVVRQTLVALISH